MSRNTSIQAQHNKKLKKGATSQCLTSITKTEQHSIVLSPKPQNQLTAEKNLYPITSVTQSMSPTAKTTGPLISNTPDSPKNTKEHLVLVKSNYPAEQFTDKKKYLCFFYIMQFTGMYPDGDLYNKHGQRVGTFNAVWNKEYFKNKHKGKEDHIWVQASNDSYYADQANIDSAIENWICEKEERESSDYVASEDPSRAFWEQAIDYVTQQLQRNRTSQGSEERSSSEESEYSEQDRASGREQEEWQEEEEKVDSEEERWKSHSRCHKEEKEEVDGGGDRCRQQEQRRRNKRDSGAEPEGNMDEPLCKCLKASEDMQ